MCVRCEGADHKAVMGMLQEKIEQFGWAIGGTVEFMYTVGLTMKKLPELCIENPRDVNEARSILNELGVYQSDGATLTPGQTIVIQGRLILIQARSIKGMSMVKMMFRDSIPAKPTALSVQLIGSKLNQRP